MTFQNNTITKKQLEGTYKKENLTEQETAKKFGVHQTTISRMLKKFGINKNKMKGRHYSPESEFKSGRTPWNERLTKETDIRIAKYAEGKVGTKASDTTKEKMRQKQFGKHPKTEFRKGHKPSQLAIEKARERLTKLWQNPEYRIEILSVLHNEDSARNRLEAIHNKPNKAELKLNIFLQTHFPKEWQFVGDGQFILGGKCPDFLNCNGKKQVIELFGNWFHSKEFAERHNRKYESPENRIEHFKRYGFDCLIIWENELKNENSIIEKIKGVC